jgi:hypothetical protein
MRNPISEYLAALDGALPYAKEVRRQVIDESRDHLLSIVTKLQSQGIAREEAERRAVALFGRVEDLLERFEAKGGPTPIRETLHAGFGMAIGSYAGLAAAFAIPSFAEDPLSMVIGMIVGGFLGATALLRRNSGAIAGAAFGIIVGEGVEAYLVYDRVQAPMDSSLTAWIPVLFGLAGAAMGLIPRLRRAAALLVWTAAVGLVGHLIPQLWLEDFSSLVGLLTLGVGALIGGLTSFHPLARRFSPVAVGGLLGVLIGVFLLLGLLMRVEIAFDTRILFIIVQPAFAVAVFGFLGAMVGYGFGHRRSLYS